jgi:AraC-like DNA-binding protein
LAGTEPVGEIALQCGFGSSSYFGKIFLEKTGMTPSDCRKKR